MKKLYEDIFDNIDIEKSNDREISVNPSDNVHNFMFMCRYGKESVVSSINFELSRSMHYILNAPCINNLTIHEIAVLKPSMVTNDTQMKNMSDENLKALRTKINGYSVNIEESKRPDRNWTVFIQFSASLDFKRPKELWDFLNILCVSSRYSYETMYTKNPEFKSPPDHLRSRKLFIYPNGEPEYSEDIYYVHNEETGGMDNSYDENCSIVISKDSDGRWDQRMLISLYYMFLSRRFLNKFIQYMKTIGYQVYIDETVQKLKDK